jgi:Tfp pilus assembly protein PilV
MPARVSRTALHSPSRQLSRHLPGRAPRGRRSAFTLVEVMMGAIVMIAGIVGMMQVVMSGSEMLDVSRKQTIATQIIHSEIDKMHLSDWTTVNALPSSASITINTSLSTISTGFSCTRTVSVVRTDMKKITFTVTWTGNTGHSYSRTGSTYFGKNGLYVTYQRS